MTVILIGRFITGFFVAGVGVSNSLIGELSSAKRRGKLNYLFDLLFCAGVLFIYLIGTWWGWRIQAGCCSIVTVIFLLHLVTIPESPISLIRQKKMTESKKSLRWARDREDVEDEWNTLRQSVQKDEDGVTTATRKMSYWSKKVMKPIFLATALQFFLQTCGVVPIVCYAVDVFRAAGTEGLHENVSTILLGVVNLVATFVAFWYVDKFGRRFLLITSEAILTLTLGLLAGFFYGRDVLGYFSHQSWAYFPLACFFVYIVFYSFGVGPLPWVIMGEIFFPDAKSFSGGVVIFFARAFGFLVMFFFKDMILLVGQHGVYLFFSVICFCGFVFAYFFIPETKGREQEDIQRDIQQRWLFHGGA